jgi:aminopeptidase N
MQLSVPLAAAAPPTPATSAHPVREVLPAGVTPEHYDLDITPDASSLAFTGSVRITVQVAAPLSEITLNAADLEVDVALVDQQPVARVVPDPAHERLRLQLARPLPAGRHELLIRYRGKILQHAEALFALDYDVGGHTKRALYTQFEASDARRFVPCWDEPAYKASWTLSATVPEADMTLSNMPVADEQPTAPGLKHLRFASTPKMSAYLLFFASGDFERVHRMADGVDVGVVVPRGLGVQAGYALDAAAELLPFYNEYFGVRFPLPKLDLVAGPGSNTFFGAMENWGAIFSFQSELLVDPALSTESDRRNVYEVTAHEMAHQWFGDLVTMAWWDGLWLNEGFATWMASRATDHFHPQWQVWLEAQGGTQDAMRMDAASGTHPVITPVVDARAADQAFDVIAYQKGSAVIRMLEQYAGEDVFRDGVRRYLRAKAYGNSVTDELWSAVAAAGARHFVDIAQAFTLQPGVPLVTVASGACRNGQQQLRLRQGRYATDASGHVGPQVWPVPVRLRALASGATLDVQVAGPQPQLLQIAGCGAVLANAGQSGYYRVRYQGSARTALFERFAQLPSDDQLGVYNDTVALAFTGEQGLDAPLELAARLPLTADAEVWQTALATLARLDALQQGQPRQAAFRARARQLLQPLLAQVGWDATPGEPGNRSLERAELLRALSRFDDAPVIDEARARYRRWLQAPAGLDAAQRDVVLAIVAVHADAATWEQLRGLAAASRDPLEAQEFWYLLGAAADPALAQRALELALTGDMPRTQRPRLMTRVSARYPDLASGFVITHWPAARALLDVASQPSFAAQLAAGSSDPATAAQLAAYAREQVPATARGPVTRVLAGIGQNQRLRARTGELDHWVAGIAH